MLPEISNAINVSHHTQHLLHSNGLSSGWMSVQLMSDGKGFDLYAYLQRTLSIDCEKSVRSYTYTIIKAIINKFNIIGLEV